MQLNKNLIHMIDSDDGNVLQVRSHSVFRYPKHSDDVYLAVEVVHSHSGLRYTQMLQLPTTVAKVIGRDLSFYGETSQPSHPDF